MDRYASLKQTLIRILISDYHRSRSVIKDITSRSYREQYSNKVHFEITEIAKNIGLKLAVAPLTESRDKYLCLCLQFPTEMRTDGHQQIISKLTNVIQ